MKNMKYMKKRTTKNQPVTFMHFMFFMVHLVFFIMPGHSALSSSTIPAG